MGYNWVVRVVRSSAYRAWIDGLRDQSGRARILMRVDRLIHGNAGASRYLAEGNKSTQSNDIAKAIELNRQFLEDRQ